MYQFNNQTCLQQENKTLLYEEPSETNNSDVVYRRNIANSIPAIVMSCLLGVLIPFLGKKFVLILPIIGFIIEMIIALAIIYLKLDIYWWYLSAFMLGLLGNVGLIDYVINLIIVDLTNPSNRSLWFVRFYALKTALTGLITFLISIFVRHHSYVVLFWLALVLLLISVGVVLYCFDLSLYNYTNRNMQTQLMFTFDIFIIFYGERRTRKQKFGIFLVLFAYAFYALATSAESTFIFALANYPICWSVYMIDLYLFVIHVSIGIFSILGYHLFRLIIFNDVLVCAISHVFFLISVIWAIFARSYWQVFANSVFYSFAHYQNPLTLAILSKYLRPDEVNIAYIFIIIINQFITSFGDLFFRWIYTMTMMSHRNMGLYLMGGFCIIPLVSNICLYWIKRRPTDPSPSVVNERSALLVNADDDLDSSTDEIQNSDQSQTTDEDVSSVSVPFFSIGNMTFIANIGSRGSSTNQSTSIVKISQNDASVQTDDDLICL
ncbi:unnamed protein product [Adineta steineri]|uniref:Uncharacterized protein n=1 Tax=Adineta steineri TaxID=433720 RepID=A0A814D159_9BILA|nr:unnamed protein product [Adineta steineri]CAF3916720.1 unnamed protein product [Adineta steineri]